MLLRVMNLRKKYKDVQAVDGVSFHIDRGEVFGLLGENGAGKTTTIKILSTLTEPDGGKVEIDGEDISENSSHAREKIAIVPQDINLDKELNIRDNLYVYAKLHNIDNAAAKVKEIAGRFGIDDKLKKHVSQLSGGQQRRVMLARVMLGEPLLIFMDEPTIGLDPSIRQDIWQMIREISGSGKAVLLTTHYTEEAEKLCTRVALMQKGKLVHTGTPEEVIKQTGAIAADMVADGVHITRLFESGADLDRFVEENRVTSFDVRKPRLEDVLLSMNGDR